MAFLEIEFPRNISYHRLGSASGFSTSVNQGQSGQESRNQNWANSRGEWTVSVQTPGPAQFPGPGGGEGPRRESFVETLIAFHLNVAGKAIAFRFKDHLDCSIAGQTIGVGNGSKTIFQLIKSYTIGSRTYVRNITKPIMSAVMDYQGNALANSVTIAVNGTPLSMAGNWTVDYTTGIITFASAPTNGAVITTPTGQFHYPVRFDVDKLPVEVMPSAVGSGAPIVSINAVPLLEVLPPNY